MKYKRKDTIVPQAIQFEGIDKYGKSGISMSDFTGAKCGFYKDKHLHYLLKEYIEIDYDGGMMVVLRGEWIVKEGSVLTLYTDEQFKELFEEV